MASFLHPEAIVSTDWLADNLGQKRVRIFESTVFLHHVEEGPDAPYRVESGRAAHNAAHIPGSGFIDLAHELCDKNASTHFMMPNPDVFANVVGRAGLGDEAQVVIYSRGSTQWATRFWWMLRAMGFDNAAVLDGCWEKWVRDGLAISDVPSNYEPAIFTPKPRSGFFVGKESVLSAIGDPGVCTINALLPELHRGDSKRYGRPGHIPGSVNLPCGSLVNPETNTFRPPGEIESLLRSVGADASRRSIIYCGGGIAATLDAFLMWQLGYDNISIYDASMSEWAKDDSLPIETD